MSLAPLGTHGVDEPARRRRETAARLADAARARIERVRPGAILLTGGETAIAVLRALGAGGLRLTGELEPGLALGTLAGGPFDGLVVMTKAGGFGDADTLATRLGGLRVTRPVLGITMGDPAGIGPEIAAKALAEPEVRAQGAPARHRRRPRHGRRRPRRPRDSGGAGDLARRRGHVRAGPDRGARSRERRPRGVRPRPR